jgi:hypothetical protein
MDVTPPPVAPQVPLGSPGVKLIEVPVLPWFATGTH